ncbi:MAG: phosphotyrosine protein phosphatase [Bdellovibrionaceae bacterium]|nr:phosphotyrosine protein phosphatase [Pseudobdellovibrionaceae bacterium]
MKRVLFVCLGNICRSPAAEGIFAKMVKDANLENLISYDSAGTIAHHRGEPADGRMQEHAKQRGYELLSRSRKIELLDFDKFDIICTMDTNNFRDVLELTSNEQQKSKVVPMTQFCKIHEVTDVPDPYYGGDDGFRLVMDILEDACSELLISIQHEKL